MEDRPGTDTLELDQQQEHDVHGQAVSVLSSIDEIQELEDAPVQQPRSRLTMEDEYLGVHIGPRARGDISSKASHYFLHQRIIQKDYQTLKVGYNLDVMRRSTCLVLNTITVYNYGFLFNCTTVGQASDSMAALD